jgi:hypothetical protein
VAEQARVIQDKNAALDSKNVALAAKQEEIAAKDATIAAKNETLAAQVELLGVKESKATHYKELYAVEKLRADDAVAARASDAKVSRVVEVVVGILGIGLGYLAGTGRK